MICPCCGANRAEMDFSNVVFPEPDSPTIPNTSPGYSWKETSLNPLLGAYKWVRFSTDNSGWTAGDESECAEIIGCFPRASGHLVRLSAPTAAGKNRYPSKQTSGCP